VGLFVASVALAGCGDDDGGDSGAATTTPPPDPTTTTVPVEAEVEEAYLAYWAMLDRLAQDPDPNDPEIHERATGEALDELVDFVAGMRDAGWRSVFGEQHGHDILAVTVDHSAAVVAHCAVDDSQVIDTSTGQVVRQGTASVFYEGSLVEVNGTWRVEGITETDAPPGDSACG
jgi:hypothetical protein